MSPTSFRESSSPLAIIGGNALGALPNLIINHRRVERTPYGAPSSPLLFGKIGENSVVFLARHGVSFTLAPDEVNDVANIYALHKAGAKVMVGISSAIALSDNINAGDFVLPDQIIDMTNQRISRFPRPPNTPHRPLQFAEPFDMVCRQSFYQAKPADAKVHMGGTYIITSGLRSETFAEAHFYRTIGGSILGSTGAQEAALARDLGVSYVSVLVIVRQAVNHHAEKVNLNLGDIASKLSQWIANYE